MKKRLTVMSIAAGFLLSASAGAYAGANLQEIKAYLNPDLKVKLDGKYIQLKDANNGIVTPISYDGTTYLPLRAISDALHIGVDYEQATKTVALGLKAEGVAINSERFDTSYYSKDKSQRTYKGTDYKEVLYNENGSSFMLYPNNKYQKLYLQIAAIGKGIDSIKFKDSATGALLHTDTVSIEDGMKTIEVDIGGVKSMYVDPDWDGYVVPLTTSYYK